MSEYTFSFSTNFASGLCCDDLNSLIEINIPSFNGINTYEDNVIITFNDRLTADEELRLNDIIRNYSYTPPLESVANPTSNIWIIQDKKSNGTNGGTASVGWNTRTLNTVTNYSTTSDISLSGNTIKFSPGVYSVNATSMGVGSVRHKLRLQNITDSTTDIWGQNMINTTSTLSTPAILTGIVNTRNQKDFQLQHYFSAAIDKTGLGSATSAGIDTFEIYTTITIVKLA